MFLLSGTDALIVNGLTVVAMIRVRVACESGDQPPIPCQGDLFNQIPEGIDSLWYHSGQNTPFTCLPLTKNRLLKEEVHRILSLCYLDNVNYRFRYKPTPLEALCLVLIRLAYPHWLLPLCDIFGWQVSFLNILRHNYRSTQSLERHFTLESKIDYVGMPPVLLLAGVELHETAIDGDHSA